MAKSAGFPFALTVADSTATARNIANDVTNLAYSTPRGVQDVTGIDRSAIERLLLLADFSITLNGVFNPTTNQQHTVFRTVPSTSVARATSLTIASQVLAVNALYSDYATTRGQDGSLTWTAPGVLADGAVPTWA